MKPLAPRDALALVLGPAWSQNTPHTAEEASVILGATEPRHALRERLASRKAAAEGRVVLEPSPRVTPGEPMPEATMPRAQWRATWRDAEVPVLCALRERCEASGALPVIPWCSNESAALVKDRHGPGVAWASNMTNDPTLARYIEGLVCMRTWPEQSRAAGPYDVPRDWCPALGGGLPAIARDEDPAATWQAMRAACPERVYPEPTGGESE